MVRPEPGEPGKFSVLRQVLFLGGHRHMPVITFQQFFWLLNKQDGARPGILSTRGS